MGFINRQLAIMQLSFKQMWAYKFDFVMWAVSHPLRLLVYYFLWKAIYTNMGQAVIRGFTFNQMVSYYLLGTVIAITTSTWVDSTLANKIKHGHLIKDLVKPYQFFTFQLSSDVGERVLAFIIQCVPLLAFGVLFLSTIPYSPVHLVIFAVSLMLALVLHYALVFLFGTLAFWVKEYRGIRTVRHGIFAIASGAIIPLTFFPEVAQKIFSFLPFQYMHYTPILIFNGQLSIAQSINAIAIQAAWIVGLILLYRWVWKRALKKFTGVGA